MNNPLISINIDIAIFRSRVRLSERPVEVRDAVDAMSNKELQRSCLRILLGVLAVAASNLRYLSIYLVSSLFLVSESVQMNGTDHKFRGICYRISQLFCVSLVSGMQRIQPPMVESPQKYQ